jgi:hypothetical protein
LEKVGKSWKKLEKVGKMEKLKKRDKSWKKLEKIRKSFKMWETRSQEHFLCCLHNDDAKLNDDN